MARTVQHARAEHAELLAQRRCRAAVDVVAPRRLASRPRGVRQGAQPRVVSGAAVVDAGGGDVAQASAGAGRQPALLELLLVPTVDQPLVERPDEVEHGAAYAHVHAPGDGGVAVLLAEVERRDRRAFAPAGSERMVLEARVDRAGQETDRVRCRGRRGQQRAEPPGVGLDVVIEEQQPVSAARRGDPGVPRAVDPARGAGDHPRSGAFRDRSCLLVGGVGVVDDDHVDPGGGRLRHHAAQGHAEVARPMTGGHDDRGSQGPQSRFAAGSRAVLAHPVPP